jgi:hypothetical protein
MLTAACLRGRAFKKERYKGIQFGTSAILVHLLYIDRMADHTQINVQFPLHVFCQLPL